MNVHKSYSNSADQHLSQDQVQRYQASRMTTSEMHEVEKHLLSCEFCSDAIEGMSMLSEEENTSALEEIRTGLASQSSTKKRLVYWQWGMAASIALLLSIASVWFVKSFLTENEKTVALEKNSNKKTVTAPPHQKENTDTTAGLEEMAMNDIAEAHEAAKETPAATSKEKAKRPAASKANRAEPRPQERIEARIFIQDTLNREWAPVPAEESMSIGYAFRETLEEKTREEDTSPQAASRRRMGAVATVTSDQAADPTERIISGTILDMSDGTPIPGVNVSIANTRTGVVSGIDGSFQLKAPEEDLVLRFDYVGYVSTEQPIKKGQNAVAVKLSPDIRALSEVVVTETTRAAAAPVIKEPVPVMGRRKYKAYLKENIRYPQAAIDNKVKGVLRLKFVVMPDGSITEIRVIKSLGHGLDEEAIRLLQNGPAWKPATSNGVPFQKEVKLSIPLDARQK